MTESDIFRNLHGRGHAAILALHDEGSRQFAPLGLRDGCFVKTDVDGSKVHVESQSKRVVQSRLRIQMTEKVCGVTGQGTVDLVMMQPKAIAEMVGQVLLIGSLKMSKTAAVHGDHEHDSCE